MAINGKQIRDLDEQVFGSITDNHVIVIDSPNLTPSTTKSKRLPIASVKVLFGTLWQSITGITSLITSEPVKINTLITDKQSFSPVINTQIIDLLLGDVILLDVTGVTGDLTLTLNNPTDTGAWEIILTEPLTTVDIIFPAGTKTLNGSGDTVLGIASATQRILFDYNGTYFTILETGEVN